MKRIVFASLVALTLAGAYIALPFWTAFSIREAVKADNATYLAAKIEWPSVRETMRQSLKQHALKLPQIGPASDVAAAGAASRGLWQRVKDYAGTRAIDAFVDTYGNAEGLPKLHRYRRIYRENVAGAPDDRQELSRLERMKRAWARIVRAEFHSPFAFEIEQRDRFDPSRSYVGLLRLRGLEWKLSELRIKSLSAVAPLASMN